MNFFRTSFLGHEDCTKKFILHQMYAECMFSYLLRLRMVTIKVDNTTATADTARIILHNRFMIFVSRAFHFHRLSPIQSTCHMLPDGTGTVRSIPTTLHYSSKRILSILAIRSTLSRASAAFHNL